MNVTSAVTNESLRNKYADCSRRYSNERDRRDARWAEAAFENEKEQLQEWDPRRATKPFNSRLFLAGVRMGEVMAGRAGKWLDENVVFNSLLGRAIGRSVEREQAEFIIQRGLEKGRCSPRDPGVKRGVYEGTSRA